jgi:MoaA/NifB/PqqE/SkfB family radical SAM enzyme
MDLFFSNITNLINNNFPSPASTAVNNIKNIAALSLMLRYDREKDKALNLLSRALFSMGQYGEAYKAASCLPPGLYKETSAVMNYIENVPCRNLVMNFEIITTCNLRCPMCSQGGETGKPYDQKGKVMSLPIFRDIWDKIRDHTKLVVLVGQGETFTHPKVYEILDYISPKPIYIDTNGNIPLDPVKIVNSSIADLVFSLDGIDQRTYSRYRIRGNFDKVIQNIRAVINAKKLYGRGPLITLKYILFKHTEPYTEEIKQLATTLGVDKLQFVPCVVHPAHSEKLIKDFYPHGLDSLQSRVKYVDFDNKTLGLPEPVDSPYCLAPLDNPQIKINGDMNVCCSSFDKMGNILENNLLEIWNSKKYSATRTQILTNRYNFADCLACSRSQNNFGHLFDGTVMEYQKPPIPSSNNTLWIDNLQIDDEYLLYLTSNNLSKDINYFTKRNSLKH